MPRIVLTHLPRRTSSAFSGVSQSLLQPPPMPANTETPSKSGLPDRTATTPSPPLLQTQVSPDPSPDREPSLAPSIPPLASAPTSSLNTSPSASSRTKSNTSTPKSASRPERLKHRITSPMHQPTRTQRFVTLLWRTC
ncbi:uncharacterized protein LY89DRAFT_277228 [Mollisia scopiformis]|uniref:Uncharacterized protein n=1 Tax=Mollisia scopiformis TaxID=149040 RepID=A0A132BDN7_MOLSC|nr:uncharacterized protein LY89DRAFT_277228 [Mollisia scopiformis]KUJ09787.1 hypothetical protein LY89DRAFT_277228 [Mollisia scopiformis]